MQSNFKLVLEGHSVLNNKIKLNLLNQKIDAVAADLAAHCAPYRVSESPL